MVQLLRNQRVLGRRSRDPPAVGSGESPTRNQRANFAFWAQGYVVWKGEIKPMGPSRRGNEPVLGSMNLALAEARSRTANPRSPVFV
jgi:hypothetical protein